MKGKDTFTKKEIAELKELIVLRNKASSSEQKSIRNKMRNLGFYGRDDWDIIDLKPENFEDLINSGKLKIVDRVYSSQSNNENYSLKNKDSKNEVAYNDKDENYVIDLCDKVLGKKSLRQHKFDFLLGDICKDGKCRKLPVDCYYESLYLVIEYREKQHTEKVPHFDKPDKLTVSGVDRGKQREIYDERRRKVLPEHNIALIEISYSDFNHNKQKRIIRNLEFDEKVIKNKLEKYI